MSEFKIAAHLLVKDEGDIIKECLDSVAPYCDYIFVIDNGSSDSTYEICREHPRVTWSKRIECTYSDALRQHFIEVSKTCLSNQDWILTISADHFFDDNPRLNIKRAIAEKANVITYDVAQFYLTDIDCNNIYDSRWICSPVQERLKYYAINYFGFPVALQYDSAMVYKEDVTEWPMIKDKRVASFSPILKHYQFRSVDQIQKRLSIRKHQIDNGFGGFRHYRSYDWGKYIINSSKLHRYDGNWMRDKKPTLDDLLDYRTPLVSRIVSCAKKALRLLK